MDNLWPTVLMAQEQGLWRLLAPLLVMAGIVVFRWINEKAKQKEREQLAQDKAQREAQDPGAVQSQPAQQDHARQLLPTSAPATHTQRQARPSSTQQIHRYQPQIPSAPTASAEYRPQQLSEPESVIMAEDDNAEDAQRKLRLEHQQRAQAEALRRTRAQQARNARKAARQTERPARENLDTRRDTSSLVQDVYFNDGSSVADGSGAGVSISQIRAAVVWSEILGLPRALRPYEQAF